MIGTDEDALICDLAETYHILDFRGLSPSKVAVLSCGLSDSSRIKTRLSGNPAPLDLLMTATILDYLALLVWMRSKDGKEGKKRPKSFAEAITGRNNKEIQSYSTVEAFEAARERIRAK